MNTPDAHSTETAFDADDYMGVALKAHSGQWQYHAARGIACDPRAGIEGLSRFDHDRARFFSAVLAWMDGDEDTACRGLERLQSTHARNLLALIRHRRVRVLSMLHPIRHGAFVLRDGIRHDDKFEVINIGYLPDDVKNRPNASITELCPSLTWPDFFVGAVIEWHQIPTDLRRLPCPTIGFTNDFDLHIQGIQHWFHPFDVRVVIDHVYEWPTLRAICEGPTVSFPLIFGAPADLPPLEDRERDIDVFFSGTLVSGYNPEKETLIRQLMHIPGIKLLLLDGHVPVKSYLELVNRAKITPSFCRHRGGIQTRVIESLAMGSISIVQPDSIMQLWADRSVGLWEYDDEIGPGPQIRQILGNYAEFARPCHEHAQKIRASFKPETIASRFFRFCTFLAAKPLERRAEPALAPALTQKRVMFAHGPSLAPAVAEELAVANVAQMGKQRARGPSVRLDIAREWLMLYARALYDNRLHDAKPEGLARAVQGYRQAVRDFPNSLVAWFNLFRVLLHLGNAEEQNEARQMLSAVLERPAANWAIEPLDDVLPYDFMPDWFNYRAYLDRVVEALATRRPDHNGMQRLILAATHHYRAVTERSLADAAQALALDGAFTPFKLTLAELLLGTSEDVNLERAAELLVELADGSMVALRAYRLLRAVRERFPHLLSRQGNGADAGEIFSRLDAAIGRLRASLLQTEHHHLKVVSPFFSRESVRAEGQFGAIIHARRQRVHQVGLSVIVAGCGGWGCAEVLRDLNQQAIPRDLFELIYVDCYGQPPADLIDQADVAVSLNQRELLECQARAWAVGLEHAQSDVVAIVQPGQPVAPTALEQIMDVFYSASPSALGAPRARQIAVVGSLSAFDPSAPQFAAFRVRDCVRAGGLDEAEVFRGDARSLTYLVDRLARVGVVVVQLADSGLRQARLTPWWTYQAEFLRSGRLSAARLIWPDLFDGNRDLLRKLSSPILVEPGRRANIVRCAGAYFVAPTMLGEIDWKNTVLHDKPRLLFSHNLSRARAYAQC